MLESRPLADPNMGPAGGRTERPTKASENFAASADELGEQLAEVHLPPANSARSKLTYEQRVVEAVLTRLAATDPKTWEFSGLGGMLPENPDEELQTLLLHGYRPRTHNGPTIVVPRLLEIELEGPQLVSITEHNKSDRVSIRGAPAQKLEQGLVAMLATLHRTLEERQRTILEKLRCADPDFVVDFGWHEGHPFNQTNKVFVGADVVLSYFKPPILLGVQEDERIELCLKTKLVSFEIPELQTTEGLQKLWQCVSQREWEPPKCEKIIQALESGTKPTFIKEEETSPRKSVLTAALPFGDGAVTLTITKEKNPWLVQALFGHSEVSLWGEVKRNKWGAKLSSSEASALYEALMKSRPSSATAVSPPPDRFFISKDRSEEA